MSMIPIGSNTLRLETAFQHRSPFSDTFGMGMQAGTPCYASPEQLAGKDMDTSTDVFSLGIVLAELICPVQTQMERAAVLEALRGRRELGGDQELAAIAVRMTDPVPSLRPSAAQLLLELEGTEAPMTIRCTPAMALETSQRRTTDLFWLLLFLGSLSAQAH
eukprot:s488_g9.t1